MEAGTERDIDCLIKDETEPEAPAMSEDLEEPPVTRGNVPPVDNVLEDVPADVDTGVGGKIGVPLGPRRTAP